MNEVVNVIVTIANDMPTQSTVIVMGTKFGTVRVGKARV